MKTSLKILLTVISIVLSRSLFAQSGLEEHKMNTMMQHDMTGKMGAPILNTTGDGLHIKLWIITQEEHRRIMLDIKMKNEVKTMKPHTMAMKDTTPAGRTINNGMDYGDIAFDRETNTAMMSGTHHIMLLVSDSAGENEIVNTSVKLLISSPAKKKSSVELKFMMGRFGRGVSLMEKGLYQLTLDINANGFSRLKRFSYNVK